MLKVMSLIISPPACPFTKEKKTQKAIQKLCFLKVPCLRILRKIFSDRGMAQQGSKMPLIFTSR
jgi:hypothetical protein